MVRKDIDSFLKTIPENITLVAATKYVDSEQMRELLKHGINNCGENRTDAFLEKYYALQSEKITWHFIGHLQRNKALDVIDKIDYLHSLDSLKLAKIIDENVTSPLKVFIEVSVNLEDSKNGVPYYNLEGFIRELLKYKNIKLVGLMMMAIKHSDDESLVDQFRKLRELRDEMEKKFKISIPYLSMGMSDDYKEAIMEGATHIRLGRVLFDL